MRWLLLFALVSPCMAAVHFSGPTAPQLRVGEAGTNGCSGTCTAATTFSITAGDSIICAAGNGPGGSFTSVTTNFSETFTVAGSASTNSVGQSIRLLYLNNSHGGSTTITYNPNTTSPYVSCQGYSGGTVTLDQNSGATGTTTTPTCTSVTTLNNNELIFAGAVRDNGSAWSAGSGYTLRGSNLTGSQAAIEDKTLSTAGSTGAAFASDAGTGSWACRIATFSSPGTTALALNAIDGCCITGDNLAVSMWIKGTADGVLFTVAGNAAPAASSEFAIDIRSIPACPTTHSLNLYYYPSSGIVDLYSLNSGVPNDGNWHHIFAVFNTQTAHILYVDGVLKSLTDCHSGTLAFNGISQNITIGYGTTNPGVRGDGGVNYWTGDIAEVGIWFINNATAAGQIIAQSLASGIRPENNGIVSTATVTNPTPYAIYHFDCTGTPLTTEPNYAVGPNRGVAANLGGGYFPLTVSGATCATTIPPITNSGRY